jgi:anti-sigma-K factor RskA
MAEEQRRDDDLAAFTDALLDDARTDAGDRPPLAETVEVLARTLDHRPPPADLCSRIHRRVAAEWPGPQPSLAEQTRGLLGLFGRPRYRWAWAAAAALVVVAVAAALILPAGSGETAGTLVGEIDATVLIIVLALLLAAVVVAAWLASRRR